MTPGLPTDFRETRRRRQDAFGLVAVVCLGLLALLIAAQVAHIHPFDKETDNCQLCIAMQTAAPVSVAATIVVLVRVWISTPIFETRAVVRRQWDPKLFTRPPPAEY